MVACWSPTRGAGVSGWCVCAVRVATGRVSPIAEELATTIASLDVLVSTSGTETFCQIVQEAMASGVRGTPPPDRTISPAAMGERGGW